MPPPKRRLETTLSRMRGIMMRIYTRYVFFGVLSLFVRCLLVLFALTPVFVIIQTSFQGYPASLGIKAIPYKAPELLSIFIPIFGVIAIAYRFSKMRANNEIIALKAMGIAPWRIIAPIYIMMFVVSLANVWLTDLSAYWGKGMFRNTIINGFESTIISQLKKNRTFALPGNKYVIDVSAVTEDNVLINPVFTCKKEDLNISAERAEIEVQNNDDLGPIVVVKLYNTEANTPNAVAALPQEYPIELPINDFFKSFRIDPPASKSKEALAALDAERQNYHRTLAAQASFALLSGNLFETSHQEWRSREWREREFTRRRNGYRLLAPRAWATGFSCFFFAWLSAPFAICYNPEELKTKYRIPEIPTPLVACVITLAPYFMCFQIALHNAKSGVLPPLSIWLGNLILGLLGAYYLKKAH